MRLSFHIYNSGFATCMLSLLLFFSCTKHRTVSEYMHELKNNKEYIQQYNNSRNTITCKYMPNTLMALAENPSFGDINTEDKKKKFLEAKKKFSNSAYFTLTLSNLDGSNVLLNDVSNKIDYMNKLNFLTSNMSDCFFVVKNNGDTVRTSLYDYQRSYGNSPDAVMLFAFPKSETILNGDEELKFYYKDRILGIPQVTRLVFDNDKLKEDNIDIIF